VLAPLSAGGVPASEKRQRGRRLLRAVGGAWVLLGTAAQKLVGTTPIYLYSPAAAVQLLGAVDGQRQPFAARWPGLSVSGGVVQKVTGRARPGRQFDWV